MSGYYGNQDNFNIDDFFDFDSCDDQTNPGQLILPDDGDAWNLRPADIEQPVLQQAPIEDQMINFTGAVFSESGHVPEDTVQEPAVASQEAEDAMAQIASLQAELTAVQARLNAPKTPPQQFTLPITPEITPGQSTSSPSASAARKVTKPRNEVTKAAAKQVVKVTKSKPSHKRKTSAPARMLGTEDGVAKTMAQIHEARFICLTQEDKARLLVPYMRGINPFTGEPLSGDATLLDFDIMGANNDEDDYAASSYVDTNAVSNPVGLQGYVAPAAAHHVSIKGPPTPQERIAAMQALFEVNGGAGPEAHGAARQAHALIQARLNSFKGY